MSARLSASAILARKGQPEPFPILTAYDAPTAAQVEAAGLDIILVGDSLANVVLGYDSTTSLTLRDMIHHAGAVVRGTKSAHVIVDLPFGSYQTSDEDAVRAACDVIRATGATSVKLEGGVSMASRVRAIAGAGIPIMAHIGVLPQTAARSTGFKVRRDVDLLMSDAHAVSEAGAYAVVLEAVEHELAGQITAAIPIPTVGIGSGKQCDAQVLVVHDIIGMYPTPPRFAKRYAEIGEAIRSAAQAFAADVRGRAFP